jgi:hypothetical protein
MQFTDHFEVVRTADDDWFDPILTVDTKLFVDPFLIFQDDAPHWGEAHRRVVAHFDEAFRLLALSGCTPDTVHYKAALRMLKFPEPTETCLGYTAVGTDGAGSGKGFANSIAAAMCDAIGRGVKSLEHFEQLDIFQDGIGPDRISDITTTILKDDLVRYTQEVAERHGVPTAKHRLRSARFDHDRHRFVDDKVELPTSPVTGGPIVLVPARFLRELPSINASEWWEAMEGTELRDEVNADVLGRVSKKDIVEIARRHPDEVEAWVKAREKDKVAAYDLQRDPRGLYQWSSATRRWVRVNPLILSPPTTEAEFFDIIELIIGRFRQYIEQEGGWRLLWDRSNEKPEYAIQLVFMGIAKAYCEANGINVDREVELGRGPVDFKFSNGTQHQALIEVKKLENGKFWNGVRAQLPSYLASNGTRTGWVLAVRFRTDGVAKSRAAALPGEVAAVSAEHDLDLRYSLVDARPKLSASNLTPSDLRQAGRDSEARRRW